MAVGDRTTVRIDDATFEVIEVERPAWGNIVYRSADDPSVLYLSQLVSVGPYKTDIDHTRRLTPAQCDDYAAGRLDLLALAEAASTKLNRPT